MRVWGVTDRVLHRAIADTPGLFAPIHDYQWDSRVVSFTLLASSTVLYNSFRTVDQAAVQTLAHVGALAEIYAGMSSGPVLDRAKTIDACLSTRKGRSRVQQGKLPALAAAPAKQPFLPKLLWVIRDSELQLTDKAGATISAQQW